MKQFIFAIAALIALAGAALSQQSLSLSEQIEQKNSFIKTLEEQRNGALNQVAIEQAALMKAQAEVAKLTKENTELKAKYSPNPEIPK